MTLLITAAFSIAQAQSANIARNADKRSSIENKRLEKKTWDQQRTSSFADKSFPIQEWGKHYSSVGSKRAAISVDDGFNKEIYKTEMFDSKEVSYEMSDWNARMTDLHKKAGITMDDQAQVVADAQLYSALLQDPQRFRDMKDEVSLRDINRYQFRRNRSDAEVPVTKAGSAQ